MAVIKSGATSDNLTVDVTSKAARTTLYNTSGTVLATAAAPLIVSDHAYTVTGKYVAGCFRCVGSAGSPQNLASIENPVGSGVTVVVRRITVSTESTAVLTTVSMTIGVSRPAALPTGGTVQTPMKLRTSYGNATAIVRGAASADGTNGTAITATPGDYGYKAQIGRIHTAVGYHGTPIIDMLPSFIDDEDDGVVLAANQALLLNGVTAAASTTHFDVNIWWEEY